jgi:hypothetical protein
MTASSINYNTASNVVTVTYPYSGGNISNYSNMLWRSNIAINNLTVDCSKPADAGVVSFKATMQQAACSACPLPAFCTNNTLAIHCPTPCPRGGMGITGYIAQRLNYGKPDNNNDGLPDASGTLDMTKVKTNFVMYGDTLTQIFQGKVVAPSTGLPIFTNGYATATISSNAQYITALSTAKVEVFPVGGGASFVCNVPITNPATGVYKVDYSIANLGACKPATYTTFNAGDSVAITLNLRVSTNRVAQVIDPVNINTEYYLSDKVNPTLAADKYQCGSLVG